MASALPSAPAPWEAPLTSGPIPIKLSLGGADLEFDRGAWTGQRPQASAAVSSPRPTVAVAEMERLQKQLQELEASVAASETEKRQLEFKNRLLTEMVRVSSCPHVSVRRVAIPFSKYRAFLLSVLALVPRLVCGHSLRCLGWTLRSERRTSPRNGSAWRLSSGASSMSAKRQ